MKNNPPIKVLWVSPMAPYDEVRHAGGKTHNFYTKGFGNDPRFETTLLTYCVENEAAIVEEEFHACGIHTELIEHPTNKIGKLMWRMINAESVLNPWNRYAGLTRNQHAIRIKSRLRKLKAAGYQPDVIILHWTQMNLLAPWVCKQFPESRLVEMEVDYTYLGYQRRADCAEGILNIWVWKHKAKRMKQLELASLALADLVIVNNLKDQRLLQEAGLSTAFFKWTPFYQSMLHVRRAPAEERTRTVVFYGAMDREENWRSAIWFIEKVMPLLQEYDITFRIIGGNPDKRLLAYQSERVQIAGFVEDISQEFSHALCLAAPLVLGAGIKVKVIEGLSSGLPVLTNDIGIEGIFAEKGRDYLHCETPEEYRNAIVALLNGEIAAEVLEQRGKKFISEDFNFNIDIEHLKDVIENLVSK